MSYINHLRTFLEVYRQKSFSKAAEQLGMSQPSVSLHIQALENLVGKKLFVRLPRGVEPTEVANELAGAVALNLDELEQKLAVFKSGAARGGTVHLAAPADFAYFKLAEPLQYLMNEGFTPRVQTGGRNRLFRLLAEKEVDFAITATEPAPQDYAFEPVFEERPLLVSAPSFAHKIGKSPSKEVLRQLPLIAFDEELALIRPWWVRTFNEEPQFQAALTVPDLRLVKRLVMQGAGWTVLPDYHCGQELRRGRLQTFGADAEMPAVRFFLVWHKHRRLPQNLQYAKQRLLDWFNLHKV